ncbi:MAG: ATP-grasp domain-containing protein, partial [Planctomycetota bacterium]
MKLYEYQARQLLADAKIPVPGAATATNAEEAKAAYEGLGTEVAVVKAQVHAGGRGKGGGVKLVRSGQEAFDVTGPMMDKPLVTHQTGPEGVPVNTVMVAAGV